MTAEESPWNRELEADLVCVDELIALAERGGIRFWNPRLAVYLLYMKAVKVSTTNRAWTRFLGGNVVFETTLCDKSTVCDIKGISTGY